MGKKHASQYANFGWLRKTSYNICKNYRLKIFRFEIIVNMSVAFGTNLPISDKGSQYIIGLFQDVKIVEVFRHILALGKMKASLGRYLK